MALSGLPVPSFFSQTVRLSFSKGRTGRSRKYLIYNDENQTASQSGRNAPERKFLLPLCGCPFRMSPGQFHETFTVFYAKVLSLFQVCEVSTDLAHSPSSEAAPGPVTVPGLHGCDRPGTLTLVRGRSRACHCSRSARLRQTWHTRPRQRPLQGLSLFQVCEVLTDLEHSQQTSVLFKDGDVPFLSDFSGKCVERSRRKF